MQSVLSKKGKMPKPFECNMVHANPPPFQGETGYRYSQRSKRLRTFHMLVPNATVVKYTLKRKSKPQACAGFPNSSLTPNAQHVQGCASHPMSIVSIGPICSIVLKTPSETGVIPVVPEVNCSQLKSPVFEPPAPPPGVFPGVSGIVNCWFGVSPVAKSLPGRFWKNASMLPLCSWFCCACELLLPLMLMVDDAGLASNEFLPDRLLFAAV